MKKILLSVLIFAAVALPSKALTAFGNAALTATPVLVTAQSTPPTVLYFNVANANTSIVYIQFFNAAAAGSVTLGTTAPTFWIAVPATNGVIDTPFVNGFTFSSGIVVAATTTPTGSTAPSTAVPITIFFR